jgi:hypothetical protein
MTTLSPEASGPTMTDETLKLKCPDCGGGLNLKRKHLGITGNCVHCHSPITAVEGNGEVSVVSARPAPAEAPPVLPAAPEAAGNVPSWGFPSTKAEESDPAMPEVPEATVLPPAATLAAAAPAETATPLFGNEMARESMPSLFNMGPAKSESFSSFLTEREEPATPEPAPPAPASSPKEQGIEFSHRELSPPPAEDRPAPSLFGDQSDGPAPFSSLFKMDEPAAEVGSAWGTKAPQENHASISPFSTGSAEGGGFAETLFREKVEKDSGMASTPSALFSGKQETPATPKEEKCGERTILDGDGRPMKPMTKEEEEQFAKHFFAIESARSKPKKWMKRVQRFVILQIVLASAGTGIYFFTPKEKLAQWKTDVYNWLEPGMAILDYIPEGLRPNWLPRSSFGIDAGVDENGVPKKKMNAFEGLKQLNVDIDKYRGSAEAEMNALKDIK